MSAFFGIIIGIQGIALLALTLWVRDLDRRSMESLDRDLQLLEQQKRIDKRFVEQVVDDVLQALQDNAKPKKPEANA